MTDKKTEKKEHPQAKWLRAIADGETLEWQDEAKQAWSYVSNASALSWMNREHPPEFRIKPRTITIGKYEVAE